MHNTSKTLLTLICLSLLGGCAGKQEPHLYNWYGYQKSLYDYYRTDQNSYQEQITALQKNIETSKTNGTKVPPGLHAQLGMLYSRLGNTSEAYAHFEEEKNLFPESTQYINFLLKNKTNNANKGNNK